MPLRLLRFHTGDDGDPHLVELTFDETRTKSSPS
jgi:hypothetical protein